MKTNTKSREVSSHLKTHGGAPAAEQSPEKELVRLVSCLMLFEDTFYESGSDLAKRCADLCDKVSIRFICELAVKARTDLKLRHAPLFLMIQTLRKKAPDSERSLISATITQVIQRADELAEILALYWKDKKQKLPRQLKTGIANAFPKFSAYALGKYNRDGKVKLRDALFLTHPKPKDDEQAATWKKLVDGTLESPETWEVMLSSGKNKCQTFEQLIREEKLGYIALLRNLRNMVDSGVDKKIVTDAILGGAKNSRALPFRFITAARHAPDFEPQLDMAIQVAVADLPKCTGRTLLVVDISGSMAQSLGGKTEISRIDAACGVAMIIREQCEDATIYATAGCDHARKHATEKVPPRHAFALRDAIVNLGVPGKLGGGGIFLVQCMNYIADHEKKPFDRVIVISDEQDCDVGVEASKAKKLGTHNYIVNVGSYKPALPVTGAGWVRVSGFSERILDWIMANEAEDLSSCLQ